MHILIQSPVAMNPQEVMAGFNQDLFLSLNPPFPPVLLKRFDGSKKGDVVILELNFIFFKQEWESHITADGSSEEEIFFIDEGVRLPFFLKKWKHRHLIRKTSDGSSIVDDIYYHSPFWLLDYLLYPVLYLQFLYRKPIYRRFFKKKQA